MLKDVSERIYIIRWPRKTTNADTLIVAGTSLSVEPAASFVADFRGKNLIVMNREETKADKQATLVVRDDLTDVLEWLLKEERQGI